MRREFIATVDGSDVLITVEPRADGCWDVCVGEQTHVVDAQRIRPGTWSLLVEDRSFVVDIDERATGAAISHDQNEFLVDMGDAQRKRLARAVLMRAGSDVRGEIVRAPIAGKVVKVLVVVGDDVAAGQGVAVLEAMKMENELKAERGGSVSALHVDVGQSVETNDKLLTLV